MDSFSNILFHYKISKLVTIGGLPPPDPPAKSHDSLLGCLPLSSRKSLATPLINQVGYSQYLWIALVALKSTYFEISTSENIHSPCKQDKTYNIRGQMLYRHYFLYSLALLNSLSTEDITKQ